MHPVFFVFFLCFQKRLWISTQQKQYQYLKSYPQTVIIVSHDRVFLNEVVTDIMHLKNQKLEYYRGEHIPYSLFSCVFILCHLLSNNSTHFIYFFPLYPPYQGDFYNFLEVEREQKLAQKRAFEAQEKQRAHMQDFVDRFYNEKRSSAQVCVMWCDVMWCDVMWCVMSVVREKNRNKKKDKEFMCALLYSHLPFYFRHRVWKWPCRERKRSRKWSLLRIQTMTR